MKKDIILFDLDGTLTESAPGIINSVAYSLERLGIKDYDRKALHAFIGPPLTESYAKNFGFSREKAEKAIELFRVYFAEKGIFENALYPGVTDMLHNLKAAGLTVGVATCKPEHFAKRITEHFGLTKYMDLLSGASADESTDKPRVIENAIKKFALPRERTLMVGDRDCDITGAHQNGIKAAAVLYGYGSGEELAAARPDHTVKTVAELEKLLLRGAK